MNNELKIICNDILQLCSVIIGHSGKFSPNEILATALAIKVRNSVSCTMKILDEGFAHDGFILLRTISEATIYCCEALRNPSFQHDLYKSELDRSKRLAEKIIKFERIKKRNVPEDIQNNAVAIKKELKEHTGVQPDSVLQKLAETNDCLIEYFHFHSLGSAYVHSLPNILSSYVSIDEKNKMVRFNQIPGQEDVVEVLISCIHCLLKVTSAINKHFKMEHDNAIINLRKRFFTEIDKTIKSVN